MQSVSLVCVFLAFITLCGAPSPATLRTDFLARRVHAIIADFGYPNDEAHPTLDFEFSSAREWFADFLARYDEFVSRIPKQGKEKAHQKLIEQARSWAEDFKRNHIDTSEQYLAQGSPEADRHMKTLEARLNVLARPRFLLEWYTPRCGTDVIWWYCGRLDA